MDVLLEEYYNHDVGLNKDISKISKIHYSGQIIATSHDLGPQKVAKEGTWVKYFNLARLLKHLCPKNPGPSLE